MVRIYVANISELENESLFNDIYNKVSDIRKGKVDRMKIANDKRLSLGAEYLLMEACKDLEINYDEEPIIIDENMKPHFENNKYHFNLSHSNERVMCIISDKCVGCDVEKIHEIDLKLAKKFFSANEYESLLNENEEDRENEFFSYWTLKESFMKCTGLGMKLPLDAFVVKKGHGEITVEQGVDEQHYRLYEERIEEGYRYAWCIQSKDSEEERELIWKRFSLA